MGAPFLRRVPPLSTLLAIMVACIGGGVLSVAAAALTLGLNPAWVNKFVAFAVGALLGAVFLEVLPHALEAGKPAEQIFTAGFGGVVLFLGLEKVLICRPSYEHGAVPLPAPADSVVDPADHHDPVHR